MSGGVEDLKRRAAQAAFSYVESDMVLGLGTGSTVAHLLDMLGDAVRSGALSGIVAVPTSVRTENRARELGIDLIGLSERARLDLAIDGADEVSSELELIKGGGGALLREKMVAQASERLVIIADAAKVVDRLGTTFPLPVEVVRWGWQAHVRFLEGWGAKVTPRTDAEGNFVESDNGQLLLDCSFADGIPDPGALETALTGRAGIVETGLFLGLASEALVASEDGVTRIGDPEVKIAPSILSCDFSRLAEEIQAVEAGGADWIHVDVMDGHFVPNITIGPVITEGARRATDLPLDVHLMIEAPEHYLEAFAKAGADSITVHQEVCPDLAGTIARIHALGVRAGVAINPDTPLDTVRSVAADIDLLVIMSVHPGFGGQKYIRGSSEKLRRARSMLDEVGSGAELQVDGGIGALNAREVADAGASVLVAGSAVYAHSDGAAEGVRAIRKALGA